MMFRLNASTKAIVLIALGGAGGACHARAPQLESPASTLTPAAAIARENDASNRSRCASDFKRFDADHDGRVSLEELAERAPPDVNPDVTFRVRDQDGDGYLIENELCAWQPEAACHRAPASEGSDAPTEGSNFCDYPLDYFDVNQDGTVSVREFFGFPWVARLPAALFVDADGDRSITR